MFRKIGCLVIFFVLFTVYVFEIQAKPLYEHKMPEVMKKRLLDSGATPADCKLAEAIYQFDVDGVKNALDTDANPNKDFKEIYPRSSSAIGLTVIHARWFCGPTELEREETERHCIEILRLLFNAGAKIQQDILLYAIEARFPAVVQLLLDKGAGPNAKIREMTPVEIAERYGYGDIVNILIENGGKPMPLQEAVQLRLLHFAQEHNIVEMEKAINNGAQVNEGYRGIKVHALECAMALPTYEYERYAAVAYLLQKGANPNLQGGQTIEQGTPLHEAMFMTSLSFRHENSGNVYAMLVIEALLKAGADVSTRDESDKTPLHIAAKYNNVIGAKMLIETGAKLIDRDKDGKTPLDYAESEEMIKLLKSHGAKEE